MVNMKKFLDLDMSLKGNNATEILHDIEERKWQINMIDMWTKEDKQTYHDLCELEKIYKEIKGKEEFENERK